MDRNEPDSSKDTQPESTERQVQTAQWKVTIFGNIFSLQVKKKKKILWNHHLPVENILRDKMF